MALELYRDNTDPSIGNTLVGRVSTIPGGLAEDLPTRTYRRASFVAHPPLISGGGGFIGNREYTTAQSVLVAHRYGPPPQAHEQDMFSPAPDLRFHR